MRTSTGIRSHFAAALAALLFPAVAVASATPSFSGAWLGTQTITASSGSADPIGTTFPDGIILVQSYSTVTFFTREPSLSISASVQGNQLSGTVTGSDKSCPMVSGNVTLTISNSGNQLSGTLHIADCTGTSTTALTYTRAVPTGPDFTGAWAGTATVTQSTHSTHPVGSVESVSFILVQNGSTPSGFSGDAMLTGSVVGATFSGTSDGNDPDCPVTENAFTLSLLASGRELTGSDSFTDCGGSETDAIAVTRQDPGWMSRDTAPVVQIGGSTAPAHVGGRR